MNAATFDAVSFACSVVYGRIGGLENLFDAFKHLIPFVLFVLFARRLYWLFGLIGGDDSCFSLLFFTIVRNLLAIVFNFVIHHVVASPPVIHHALALRCHL